MQLLKLIYGDEGNTLHADGWIVEYKANKFVPVWVGHNTSGYHDYIHLYEKKTHSENSSLGFIYFAGYALDRAKVENKKFPIRLGFFIYKEIAKTYYFYMYKDAYYLSEFEMSEEEVALSIDTDQKNRQQRFTSELKKIKALAEVEDSHRMPIPEDVQLLVWKRDGGKCVRCGSNINLEFDHIIPVSKGGSNTARNIQLLCEKCNRSKGANIGG